MNLCDRVKSLENIGGGILKVFEGSECVFSLSPAGGAVPSFGDSHLGGIGRESRAQTLARGE